MLPGARLELWGTPVAKRWLKLGAPATAGSNQLVLSDGSHGWSVNQTVLVTSTTFNPWQVGAEWGSDGMVAECGSCSS